MPKRLFAGLTAVLWLFLTGTLVAHAQSPVEPQVQGVVSQPGAESLGLDVYFVVTDAQGRPILEPNLEDVTIELVGSAGAPVAATVGDPQGDIYVILLLDTSGSMQNVIGQVREAALSALKSLPANARVSVITFDDRPTPITDFTGDLSEVQNRIQRVQAKPGGATCLYDAVWDAIDRLDLAVKPPQDRRALILFTDGRDQRSADSSDPCSIHTFQDAVQKAQRQPATPIHTIGLCGADCSNINSKELQGMADDTLAFSVIGRQTELSAMFQEIMDGLNAQLVAHANVYPQQGLGQALLAVKPRDANRFFTNTFNFLSDRDYNAPPPPAVVRITELLYQPPDDSYLLTLSVGNPQSVDRLILNVEETDGGKTVVNNVQINLEGREVLQTDFDADQLLKAGKKYTLKIQAVDSNDLYLEVPGDSSSCSRDDKTILACKEFTHEPPIAPGCEFEIQSVTPDYAQKVFVFDLSMPALCDDVFYQGVIVEEETRQKVQNIQRSTFFANQGTNPLEISMPPSLLALKKNQPPPEYLMTLDLETKEGKQTSQTYAFTPPPPPQVPILTRIGNSLRQNPILLVAIFAFVIAFLAYRVYQNQRVQKTKDELRRPPVSRTEMVSLEIPQMRLKLRVLTTPGQAPNQEAVISQFPYVIGRKEGDFTLPDDQRMSRIHAQITAHGNEFFIEDLDSTNHTFVGGEKLEPRKPVRLKGATRVRFGPDTEVEIETI